MSFPSLAHATTAAEIRSRIIDVIRGLARAELASTPFVPYRNEGRGDFRQWCEENPAKALRRFQVRDTGDDQPPAVSNTDHEEREITFVALVAYPQTGRAGQQGALDRDDLMSGDQHRIEFAIGMCGRANFAPPHPDACWRAESSSGARSRTARLIGENVDYLEITQTMTFRRRMAP